MRERRLRTARLVHREYERRPDDSTEERGVFVVRLDENMRGCMNRTRTRGRRFSGDQREPQMQKKFVNAA